MTGAEDGTDVSVDLEKFPAVFAHDVDPGLAKVLAVSQRPLAALAFSEKAPAAAWKTKPEWGSVSSSDHAINPDVERFGYKRAMPRHASCRCGTHRRSHPADRYKAVCRLLTPPDPHGSASVRPADLPGWGTRCGRIDGEGAW